MSCTEFTLFNQGTPYRQFSLLIAGKIRKFLIEENYVPYVINPLKGMNQYINHKCLANGVSTLTLVHTDCNTSQCDVTFHDVVVAGVAGQTNPHTILKFR